MSSGSVVSLSSFNLLFFTHVLTALTSTVKYNEYVTDKGKNISIPCDANGTVVWIKDSVENTTVMQTGKFLILQNVSESDGGIYVCFANVSTFVATSDLNTDNERLEEVVNDETDKTNNNNHNITYVTLLKNNLKDNNGKSRAEITTTTKTIETSRIITIPSGEKSTTEGLTTSYPRPITTKPTETVTAATSGITNPTGLNNNNNNTYNIIKFARIDDDFVALEKINLTVRTPPGPVTQLYFKASTILGFLVWRFNKTMTGGYPVRSFTAEFRNVSYREKPFNSSYEHEWSRMDPINIAPNVRQMEVYHLEPNTTYEFRIWANNQLGSGAMVTTNVTTLPETKEEDLIRLIQPDLDNFDPRIWILAVSIVLGTFVILAIGLSIVLSRECYQAKHKGIKSTTQPSQASPSSSCYASANDCYLQDIIVTA